METNDNNMVKISLIDSDENWNKNAQFWIDLRDDDRYILFSAIYDMCMIFGWFTSVSEDMMAIWWYDDDVMLW